MENNNESEFEIIANKSFYIDHEPTIKEKKKRKNQYQMIQLIIQLGKQKKRNYLNF